MRHAVRATGRRSGPAEPGEVTRRTGRADRAGRRAGRRHQLRAEQRAPADGLGGHARRRGVPRAPRSARRRGRPVGRPQAPRPGRRPAGRRVRPQGRHSP